MPDRLDTCAKSSLDQAMLRFGSFQFAQSSSGLNGQSSVQSSIYGSLILQRKIRNTDFPWPLKQENVRCDCVP